MASSSLALAAYTALCILLCGLQTTATSSEGCSGLHLQYYTHEIRDGPNKTLLIAAGTNQGGNFTEGSWGSVFVFDNMIKAGASPDSKLLGRITGTTVLTVKVRGTGPVQFLAQHVFGEGSQYNGSSFTSIPGGFIPGGTGFFEGYKGYGQGVEQTIGVPPDQSLHVYLWDVCLSKS